MGSQEVEAEEEKEKRRSFKVKRSPTENKIPEKVERRDGDDEDDDGDDEDDDGVLREFLREV